MVVYLPNLLVIIDVCYQDDHQNKLLTSQNILFHGMKHLEKRHVNLEVLYYRYQDLDCLHAVFA